MSKTLSYQDWSDFLLSVGAICEPAEWHGMTVGFICSSRSGETVALWLPQALGFMDLIAEDITEQTTSTLRDFAELTNASLANDQFEMQLLLPDDALELAERVTALAKWCQGFLHGLALAGEELGSALDDDGREAVQDIVKIAQVSDQVEHDEEAEYMQLVEYVRMAAFQLYTQLQTQKSVQQQQGPDATLH